ncbi:MAG: response regulator [Pseudomonadota bacterium]
MAKIDVLIVESDPSLGGLWQRHLERNGMRVQLEQAQDGAEEALEASTFDVIILNIVLRGSSAFAIADISNALHPETPIIFVTNTTFFSDGSIFALCPNACAYLQSDTPPDDLTAMVEHYGRAS